MSTSHSVSTTPNFIPDEVAAQDDFESHSRVAGAIAAVMQAKRDLKVIGLLGPWGSGKSTVVKFVRDRLASEDKTEQFYCFTYDAWLHQSDPPRRAFLESLIRFLIEGNVTEESRWKDRLQELNRQIEDTESTTTPTLSAAGRWLLPSALLVPFGMKLVGHDWFDALSKQKGDWIEHHAFYFGVILTALPFIAAATLYLWWRPTLNPFGRKFWSRPNLTENRPPYEKESILSIFTNREIQIQRNRVVRSPDPTTIEFQGIFREIMEAVSAEGRRFLFVVDNLDRLPEAQAMEMWSTIRSFFLGPSSGVNLPTVILPVDETAVQRMYAANHDDREVAQTLAQSFMDKTFDLTFRVTRPVLSNWQAYMGKQLTTLFGTAMLDEWQYIVSSIYDRWLASRPKEPVTPRIINTLLNSMATLWLQWQGSGVSFAAIAYYVIHRERIDSDVLSAVSDTSDGIDEFDLDWRISVAALHFGVEPANAAQVMLEPELRSAISSNDADKFAALSVAPGFDAVFDRLLDKALRREAALEISTAIGLYDATDLATDAYSLAAWRKMRAIWVETDGAAGLEDGAALAVASLLRHCDEQSKADFLTKAAARLTKIPEPSFAKGSTATNFVNTLRELHREAMAAGLPSPRATVSGEPLQYLKAIALTADEADMAKCIGTTATSAKVIETISTGLNEPANAAAMAQAVKALLTTDARFQWEPVVSAAGVKLESAFDSYTEYSALTLGRLRRTQAGAVTRIQQLADSGHLLMRFNESYNANNYQAAAALGALFLHSTNPATFLSPDGQAWDTVIAARPELGERMSELLREFGEGANLAFYARLATVDARLLPLVRALVSIEHSKNVLAQPPSEELVDNFSSYAAIFEPNAWIIFVSQSASEDHFWAKLDTLTFPIAMPVLLTVLEPESSERQRAASVAQSKLEGLKTDDWTAFIDQGGELAKMAGAIHEAAPGTRITGNLSEALRQRISQFASGDAALRGRWLELANAVSQDSLTTLMRSIADHISRGDAVTDLSALLGLQNSLLLREGDFARNADGAATHLILPMLATDADIAWLEVNAALLEPVAIGAEKSTRVTVQERLATLWNSAEAEDKVRLEHIGDRWQVPLPLADHITDEEGAQAS